ncbi:Ig-like domain-containing protein [Pseudanabaena sp. 'Roaring Creek']|uniref:Ig-like domain-containing protein n=1 Tax=Pseudanabaena sp. 'Roaring Creek' TaxID=1681830 RepID=UPI0006D84419|nr:Ig-like domain-containing protein [Pseudanabaena sp. 'Roaring Creek']
MQLSPRFKLLSQPLDRYAVGLVVLLSIAIAILLWVGDRTAPQVKEFSWQGQRIDSTNISFVLTFNRPMDRDSVEKNLKFEPPLAGKISWSSRRMSYTPIAPATYGKSYQVKLENAYDRFASESGQKKVIEPFTGSFTTPNPYFAYIGSQGEDKGRLIIYNTLQKEKRVLTPANLSVLDFRVYPDRQKILFGAIDGVGQNLLDQKLYVVTTGIDREDRLTSNQPTIKPILGSDDYQNFKFDLSPDGKNILVQRLSRQQVGRYGLWLIQEDKPARSLDNQPGGDFMFTPDSASVAIAQGEGVAILPLEPQAPPLDFLPRFGTVLSFGRSGTQAATVKFNKDYTRSLYLVNNQGLQKELTKISGSILGAQFDPQEKTIYCLLTDVEQDATKNIFREKPYLAAIDLESSQLKRLLELPSQREIQFSIAPDGQSIILNSAIPSSEPTNSQNNADDSAQATRNPRTPKAPTQLIILPLNSSSTASAQTEVLSMFGTFPRWLP